METNIVVRALSTRTKAGAVAIDGRSFKQMRVYRENNQILKAAVVMLLLAVVALPGTLLAQTYPKPTVPPTPATLPTAQTVSPGFDDLGFIQYASVDAMCDPVAPSPDPDTTPGNVVTPNTPPAPPP